MVAVYLVDRKPGIGTKAYRVLARTDRSETNEKMAIFIYLKHLKMMLTLDVLAKIDQTLQLLLMRHKYVRNVEKLWRRKAL